MTRNESIWRHIDGWTILLFLLIAVCGWLNIYSACFSYETEEVAGLFDLSTRSGKQILWFGISVVVGVILLLIDSKAYEFLAYFLYALIFILLLVTPIVAHDVKGSLSWIRIGSFQLQPAEFAKAIIALAVAKYMGRYEYQLRSWRDLLIPLALIGLPMLIIIGLQRETGSALVLTSFLLMFYRQGMTGWVLIAVALCALLFIIVIRFSFYPAAILLGVLYILGLWRIWRQKRIYKWWLTIALFVCLAYCGLCKIAFQHVLKDHQRERIELLLGMIDAPDGIGYNTNQSLIAIGSGGWLGKGYLHGTQTSLHFVPEQYTDFIFCTVGEEWGFIGSFFVLLLYGILILRLIFLAERQREMFSRIFAYSVVGIFFFHVAINIGMVLGLLPVIGIPLPFFSYGGSSFLGFTILLFILLKLDAARITKMR